MRNYLIPAISAFLMLSVFAFLFLISGRECKIKGNISLDGDKIYHLPRDTYYDQTVVNPERGEAYFCTEKDALSAGFRRSYVQ